MQTKRKTIKPAILAATLAAAFSGAAQAKVYECNIGGTTVYTSRPSPSCPSPPAPTPPPPPAPAAA